jgi:NAD(P)-dependent dehydrogenase (short-subunit alcohol dehydrogenase family)
MTILVTGGGKGLGAEICSHLARAGHNVVIHYRTSEQEAKRVAEQCHSYGVFAETIQGDFATQDSLESFIDRYLTLFPKTKGIINNVGDYLIAPSVGTTSLQWLSLFQTNFFSPVFLTQALLPSLKALKGSVVNLGVSGLRASRAFTKTTAYATTKAALLFYTISLAKELAEEGVKVNMVSPGFLDHSIEDKNALFKDPSELPFKRPATLFEVAYLVASFFDPHNSYITGQNIEVAGGIGL